MSRWVTLRTYLAEKMGTLRLRGPLADDPTAKILHALLIGLLLWNLLFALTFLPAIAPGPAATEALIGFGAITYLISLRLLYRGQRRKASLVYLGGIWVVATAIILSNGGIRSPGLVLYIAIPVSAAWLVSRRGGLMIAGLCLGCALGLAVSEMLGKPLPQYFPETPVGTLSVFLMATVVASLPVMAMLRILNDSLSATQRWLGELRQAEEELRREHDLVSRIMETSPVGIAASNRDGEITFANSSAEAIFGLSRDAATKRRYNDPAWHATSYDGTPYPEENLPFRQVKAGERAVKDVRFAIRRPGGDRVLLSVNAAPVLTASGEFDGIVTAIEDVTERMRAEEELRRHREQLEELVKQRTEEMVVARDQAVAANRGKSAFLANMSHELRTPLNAILGFASLIRDDLGLSEEHRKDLDIVSRSGEHLLHLINDVLEVAKIESGHRGLEINACDLNTLVHEVVDMIGVRAEAKNLTLHTVECAGFPGYIRTDDAKVRQVLINLLANAVQYTNRGSITLRMDARYEEPAGEVSLIFDIEDTGIGIAAEDRERIFEPFVQAGKPGAPQGTGLGLTITRQFIMQLGGSIAVDSIPGKGSRFRVVIPATLAGQYDGKGATHREPRYRLQAGQPEYRVLVVEDEAENRHLMERQLRSAGFRVRAVENGAQGIVMFRSWRPDFIWMDLRMPIMGGVEAAGHIRAMNGGREVKIAAVTAIASDSEREEVLAAGLDDFVRKPYRADELFGCMARHLGVRYDLRRGQPASAETAPAAVSPEDVAALPDEVREELKNSVIALDVKRIGSVIQRISERDARLAATLAAHADRLTYTVILDALGGRGGSSMGRSA